jgi:hypothetical protein
MAFLLFIIPYFLFLSAEWKDKREFRNRTIPRAFIEKDFIEQHKN